MLILYSAGPLCFGSNEPLPRQNVDTLQVIVFGSNTQNPDQ